MAADIPKFELHGDRFKPLTYSEMTTEQRTLVDHILSGPRGSLGGPFKSCCAAPRWVTSRRRSGAYVRFKSSIPRKLNELAILMTGRYWNAQYEWYAHHKLALEAGLGEPIIADVAAGRRPASLDPDETIVYDFCHELLSTKQVGDATFKAAVERLASVG